MGWSKAPVSALEGLVATASAAMRSMRQSSVRVLTRWVVRDSTRAWMEVEGSKTEELVGVVWGGVGMQVVSTVCLLSWWLFCYKIVLW